jgi:membrane protein required for colicin V production
MNLVDLIVLAIIGISGLLGLSRGFVREMLGLGSWLLAAYGAYRLGPMLLPTANKLLENPDIAGIAAYAVAFLGLLILLSLASNLIGRAVRLSALGGLDRTLGLVFGVVRGAAVLIAAYILCGQVLPKAENWPPQIKQARTIPILYEGAVIVAGYLPETYRPAVVTPPDEHPLTSAELLHVTPDGQALGPRSH